MYLPANQLPKPLKRALNRAKFHAVAFEPVWTDPRGLQKPYAVAMDRYGRSAAAYFANSGRVVIVPALK